MRQTDRRYSGVHETDRQTEGTVPAASRCVSSVHGSDSGPEQCPLGNVFEAELC